MVGKIAVACGAVTAMVLAITGCSSGSGSGHSTAARTTGPAAGTTSQATGTATSTASATAPSTAASTTSAAQRNAVASVDVCSLMTSAQATAINKVTYSSSKAGSTGSYYQTCTYKRTASVNPVNIQSLTVSLISFPGCWSQLRSADGPGKPVSGVGEAAFGTGIGLDIEVGSRCVEISGLTANELFGNYRPDEAMAKIILAKLH